MDTENTKNVVLLRDCVLLTAGRYKCRHLQGELPNNNKGKEKVLHRDL